MRSIANTIVPILAAGLLAVPALAADNPVKKAIQDVKTGAFDLFDKETVTVDFDKAGTVVTQGDRNDLKALIDATKNDTKIEKIVVAAWSDNEYPATKDQELSKGQQDLAKTRADNVKKALEAVGATKIETFSMAEHPSWIARTFKTKDAEVKGATEPTNVDEVVTQQIGKELRSAGGPGKAVVFILRADHITSH